jgi:hypothetical protein
MQVELCVGRAGNEMERKNNDLCILLVDDESILRNVAMVLLKKEVTFGLHGGAW